MILNHPIFINNYIVFIMNILNIFGSSNSCDNIQQYCQDGYALYFPCLKDITRGQEVCFDFYIADTSTKDVVDLRDVDSISLDLNGLYGCSYGTFSYPNNISSLQTEKYPVIYTNDFGKRYKCHLDLIAIDMEDESSEMYLNFKEEDFYSGMDVSISAYDTPTHIFIGWALMDDDETCDDETWDDYIFSKENKYNFNIKRNYTIFALYRPRKKYTVMVSPDNKNCLFKLTYKHIDYYLSNRPDEIYNDSYDHIDNILEGYKIVAEVIPSKSELGDGNPYMYKFNKWSDKNEDRIRLFNMGIDTNYFEKDNEIKLSAICTGPVDVYELDGTPIEYVDKFDDEGIHIDTVFSENAEYVYYGDEYVHDGYNVMLKYIGKEGFLEFNDGFLELSSMDIEDGMKVDIYAKSDEDCELFVNVNGLEASQVIDHEDFRIYEFYFSKCDKKNIVIRTSGKCLVDRIDVCREDIIDKGKARLCLSSDETLNITTGPLSVSGAIMVKGKAYGIANTQIGVVNKLKKIIINKI